MEPASGFGRLSITYYQETSDIVKTNELQKTTTPTIVEDNTKNSHNNSVSLASFYNLIKNTHAVEIAGEEHYKDSSGHSYTLKTSDASTDRNYWEYLLSHYYAVTAYKALGVPVPEVKLYDMETGKLVQEVSNLSNRKNIGLLFKDIPGLQSIKDYLNADIDGSRYYHVQQMVQKYFAADCLFGNKGSAGDKFENMLIDPHFKVIYRMNCSGTFGYNNKGDIVGQFNTSEIKELEILRDKSQKPEAIFFKTIKNKEFKEQVEKISKKKDKFMGYLPKNFHMLNQNTDLRLNLLYESSVLPYVKGLDTIDYQAWESKTDLVEKRRFLCDVFTQEQISDEDVLKFLKSNNSISIKEIFYNNEKLNWLAELLKKERPKVFGDGSIFA